MLLLHTMAKRKVNRQKICTDGRVLAPCVHHPVVIPYPRNGRITFALSVPMISHCPPKSFHFCRWSRLPSQLRLAASSAVHCATATCMMRGSYLPPHDHSVERGMLLVELINLPLRWGRLASVPAQTGYVHCPSPVFSDEHPQVLEQWHARLSIEGRLSRRLHAKQVGGPSQVIIREFAKNLL